MSGCLFAGLFLVTQASEHERLMEAAERGLTVSTDDNMFTGAIGLVFRPRLTIPLRGEWPQLSLSMARPQLRVRMWQDRIRVFVQPEFSGTTRLLDAEVTFRPWTFLGVRAGRFVTPFSRTFYTPVPRLKFPDFAGSNTLFRVDRDIGGTLLGEAGPFDYEAGVVTGQSTVPDPLDKSHMLAVARLNAQIIGKVAYDENRCSLDTCALGLSIGANANYHRYELRVPDPLDGSQTVSAGQAERGTVGVDAAFTLEHFQLQIEGYYRRTHDGRRMDQWGAYAHASYAVIPHFMEVAVRADGVLGGATGFDAMVVGYFLGEHAKLWVQYALRREVGLAHALIVQTQIWL